MSTDNIIFKDNLVFKHNLMSGGNPMSKANSVSKGNPLSIFQIDPMSNCNLLDNLISKGKKTEKHFKFKFVKALQQNNWETRFSKE